MSYPQVATVGGPLFQTASEISTQLEQIDSEAQNLDVEIRQHVQDPQFLNSWGAWLASWSGFFNRYHESTFNIYSTGSGTVSRQAETYHTQLLAWESSYQNQAKGLPLPSSGGSTNPQSSNNLSKLSQIAGEATTKIVVLGLLGVAAYAALLYEAKK